MQGGVHIRHEGGNEILGVMPKLQDLQELAPSSMSSAEWAEVDAKTRLFSFFSARVEDEHLLDGLRDLVHKAMDGGLSVADFVDQAKDWIASVQDPTGEHREELNNMDPEERKKYENNVRNLDSRARLELIIRTQRAISAGYAQFQEGFTRLQLRMNPGWRFKRQPGAREKYKRKDHVKYENAVRLKTDFKFWLARNRKEIGGFGLPHAPFGFNSWMRLVPVKRAECVRLGLLKEDEDIAPTEEEKREYAITGTGRLPQPEEVFDWTKPGDIVSPEGRQAVDESMEEEGGKVVDVPDGRIAPARLPDGTPRQIPGGDLEPQPQVEPQEPEPHEPPAPTTPPPVRPPDGWTVPGKTEPQEPTPEPQEPDKETAPGKVEPKKPKAPENQEQNEEDAEDEWNELLSFMVLHMMAKPKRKDYKTEEEYRKAVNAWKKKGKLTRR